MNSKIEPRETRALGWYAVKWMNVTDWFKAYSSRLNHHKRMEIFPNNFSLTDEKSQASSVKASQAGHESTSVASKTEPKTGESSSTAKGEKAKGKSEEKKLKEIVNESREIIAKAKAVFPFNFFPDLITIDHHKLTIVYRHFFGVEQKVSVPIDNIKNIQSDLGPFFGSLTITSDHFINNTQTIHYLTRHDADRIQKLVQGATVAIQEGIDLSKINPDKLKNLLINLGQGHVEKAKNA